MAGNWEFLRDTKMNAEAFFGDRASVFGRFGWRDLNTVDQAPAPGSGNRSAGAFGTITSTYDPRQLQLGFKLNF